MNHIAEAFAETLGGSAKGCLPALIVGGVLQLIILALATYGALHLMGAI